MPWPLFTPRKDPVPIVQGLGGPQGQSGQVRKILSIQGFDPQTIQPVASRYTDWATQPTIGLVVVYNIYEIVVLICDDVRRNI